MQALQASSLAMGTCVASFPARADRSKVFCIKAFLSLMFAYVHMNVMFLKNATDVGTKCVGSGS